MTENWGFKVRINSSTIFLAVAILMSGCASNPLPYPAPRPSDGAIWRRPSCSDNFTKIKETIPITFYMGDYKVSTDRPSGELSPIDKLWRNGTYVYQDKVFARMDFSYPGKCSSDKRFYIVEIPLAKVGEFTQEARLISDTYNYQRIEDALPEIYLEAEVKNGILINPIILNNNQSTIGLYVDYFGVYREDPVAVIRSKSPVFINFRWIVIIPLDDGKKYKLNAKMHDSSIEEYIRRVDMY